MARSLKDVVTEYGTVALVVYLVIFVLVLGGFWVAIQAGFRPDGVDEGVGSLLGAYVLTKLTQPFRIAATLLLVPFVAKGYERLRGPRAPR
jgi:NADH:ubiquinone oxidoreductase subunit 6 (subunit J)